MSRARLNKGIPGLAQVQMFLAGAPIAIDEVAELSRVEKRVLREARERWRAGDPEGAVAMVLKHGTVDRNLSIFAGVKKTAARVASSVGTALANPPGRFAVKDKHSEWTMLVDADNAAEALVKARGHRPRAHLTVQRLAYANGRGKPRWTAFADAAARGEIILSFYQDKRGLVAVVSAPGKRDRELIGPGAVQLAAACRKRAHKSCGHLARSNCGCALPNIAMRADAFRNPTVRLFQVDGTTDYVAMDDETLRTKQVRVDAEEGEVVTHMSDSGVLHYFAVRSTPAGLRGIQVSPVQAQRMMKLDEDARRASHMSDTDRTGENATPMRAALYEDYADIKKRHMARAEDPVARKLALIAARERAAAALSYTPKYAERSASKAGRKLTRGEMDFALTQISGRYVGKAKGSRRKPVDEDES